MGLLSAISCLLPRTEHGQKRNLDVEIIDAQGHPFGRAVRMCAITKRPDSSALKAI